MDRNVIICRCQEITYGEILDAIANGASTVDGVKKRIRAGMGLCQGKTCQKLVQRIIAQETGINLAEIEPATIRVPVRPVRMGIMEEDTDEK